MSGHSQPVAVLGWLVSRASGIVALVLVSLSVVLGLAMAAKVLSGPGRKRWAVRMHEHMAVTSLVAIGIHGLALLGDKWLAPGVAGITVPFALHYRPVFTGVGIIAGYLVILLGPSFYLRRRIGARRWRSLHRATVLVWLLAAVHALGAGSDGNTVWLRVIVLAPVAPVVYLLVLRALGTERGGRRERHERHERHEHHERPSRAVRRTHRLEPMDVAPDMPAP